MTWTAPLVERVDAPTVAGERVALEAWLEWHRATLLHKCSGLTGDQLVQRAVPTSTMSLVGLLRHMAEVERSWFRRRLMSLDLPFIYWDPADDSRPDPDFDEVDAAAAEQDYALYLREVQLARDAAATKVLDDTFFHQCYEVEMDLRWVYIHMIEEYARHNGHADLLREAIDGATGE